MEKEQLFDRAERVFPRMKAAFDYMNDHPETGFREWKATEYLSENYRALGYTLHMAGDIPGFYTDIDTGRPGPKLLILGELDALPVPGHPKEDPVTHAAHACGHNAQSAVLLGLAQVLSDKSVLDGLYGSIRLCAVPAEELVELDFRESLRKAGTIKYYGGKQEFLRRGYFDGCDLAFMIHTGGGRHHFQINAGSNGCIMKTAEFIGKATHAASPSGGINALDAASLSLNAINALRTTFANKDFVRTHPIFREAGIAVNSVPGRVLMENQVRGASVAVCQSVNKRVNRAVAASAAALGANVRLCDRPGYLPGHYDDTLCRIAIEAFGEVVGTANALYNNDKLRWETGCTDMADVAAVMPAIHCYGSGSVGAGHGVSYKVEDFDCALTDSLKAQLLLLTRLLENGAEKAKNVTANAKVDFPNRADYFAYLDSVFFDETAVAYNEDGSVLLKI